MPSEIPAEIPSQVGKHRDAGRYVLGDAAPPFVQRWMAFRISSVESPFATYPRAPARSIERTVSQSSCAESAITRVEGERRRISRVALCPPPPGMRTSRSATSGNSVRATSIAPSASFAVPMRARDGSVAISAARTSRTVSSSSATSTRILSMRFFPRPIVFHRACYLTPGIERYRGPLHS